MDFTFTEEQKLMAATFRELAEEVYASTQIRAAAAESGGPANGESKNAGSAQRWACLAEMGLPGVLAPEAAGGMGLSEVDFVLIAEEAGRAAMPEPLVEHAGVAVPLLGELMNGSYIDSARGDSRAGRGRSADEPHVRVSDELRARIGDVLRAAAEGTQRVAVGHPSNPFVLGADGADHLLLAHSQEVHLVPAAQVTLDRQTSVDDLRRLFSVNWKPSAETCVATGEQAKRLWQSAFERGALFCAAQSVGLCERLVELAVAFARERIQFGKPIGSYQAIKHHLATVQVKMEFARPVLYAAAARVQDNDARAQAAVSHAKLAATDAADLGARTAIQVHGAMGYSWEVDLHFYMKRVWALAGAWGDRALHLRRVMPLVLEDGLALGPDQTFAKSA